MSTSEPALARAIARQRRGSRRRDASTHRSPAATSAPARRASRSWSAATAATFERVRPLFERIGTTIVHQGPAGSGQHTKMVNQILIATGMIGVCEALLYARRSGLDVATVLGVGLRRRRRLVVAHELRPTHREGATSRPAS